VSLAEVGSVGCKVTNGLQNCTGEVPSGTFCQPCLRQASWLDKACPVAGQMDLPGHVQVHRLCGLNQP
jgi:hypothetical protein